MYSEDDFIPLSSLQHYAFCRRQCALIHIEQIWHENVYTMEGRILHERVHAAKTEKRRAIHSDFGTPLRSFRLGLSGKADTVEYCDDGTVRIVEMKRGKPKAKGMDEIQLCAQAMCLEEMLAVTIAEGWLFYGKNRRRKLVIFAPELRKKTYEIAQEVHSFLEEGRTPPPEPNEKCPRCSLYSVCLPETLVQPKKVQKYISKALACDRPEAAE